MGMTSCRECGGQIADTATACPGCGGRTATAERLARERRGTVWGTVLAALLALAAVWFVFIYAA